MHSWLTDGASLEVVADVEPLASLSAKVARDASSAGQATLWLKPPLANSAASISLIRRGIGLVSISHTGCDSTVAKGRAHDNPLDDVIGATWFPAKIRALPIEAAWQGQELGHGGTVRLGGRFLEQEQQHRNNDDTCRCQRSPLVQYTPGDGVESPQGTGSQPASAILSATLMEALGLSSSPLNNEGDVRNCSTTVRLTVQTLTESQIAPAEAIDVSGPWPRTVGPRETVPGGRSKRERLPLLPAAPPPSSLYAALASTLPAALDGEVVTKGSVLGVADLYTFVVTEVTVPEGWVPQATSSHGGDRRRGIVAAATRVHSATEIRLEPPRVQSLPARVEKAAPCSSTHVAQGLPDDAGEQDCPETWEGQRRVRTARSRDPSSGSTATASPPSSVGPNMLEWRRRVDEEFVGLRDQVDTIIAAVEEVVRSDRDRKGRAGGGTTRAEMAASSSGLLLHGPSGAGKTLLARSVAKHSSAPWFFLDCASVFRRERGEAERHMQDFILKAGEYRPSVVVLDQVEFVSMRRSEAAGITELQVFSVLVELMDRFREQPGPRIFFLATCPDPSVIDPSLLQSGRLDLVVQLGALDVDARASILAIHARNMRLQLGSDCATPSPSSCTFVDGHHLASSQEGADKMAPSVRVPSKLNAVDDGPVTGGGSIDSGSSIERTEAAQRVRTREEIFGIVAARCHGFLGADLARLCREAAMLHMAASKAALRSQVPCTLENATAGQQAGVTKEKMKKHTKHDNTEHGEGIGLYDFLAALDVVRPASLLGHSFRVGADEGGETGMRCAELVGCDKAMAELRAFILTPLMEPSLLRGMGLRGTTGALLHGPSGCGKTSVARALARESKGVANFLEVKCSDLVDKVVGRSERAVADLFAAARAAAPSILFLDQVEGVAARRGYHSSTEQTFDRILSSLLVEMDGVMSEAGGHVVVLAATNDIARLDPAILRPGRLDRRVFLGPPDLGAREAIFRQNLLNMPLLTHAKRTTRDGTGVQSISNGSFGGMHEGAKGFRLRDALPTAEAYVEWLARETDGVSCAQVTGVCREAALAALREEIGAQYVATRHFEIALRHRRMHRRLAVERDRG